MIENMESMIDDKASDVIGELFESFLNGYQIGLETLIWGSYFALGCSLSLYYKCHKINFRWGGLYVDSHDWIKNKKSAMNAINKKDNKYFQCPVRVALNHKETKKGNTKN